jgi:hypothetical protein
MTHDNLQHYSTPNPPKMSAMKKFIITIMLVVVTITMAHAAESSFPPPPPCYLCPIPPYICGDPHFVGFDGKKFDINVAGDYLILKESDGFEISISISSRWGRLGRPGETWITEIRVKSPGGPLMKATAATATPNPPLATVLVDGVGTVAEGESYTDPTTSLKVRRLGSQYIEFVAPRWTLTVSHLVAHVIKDGWHYFNMGIEITKLLETPVTGVLGVTYNPETYARLGDQGLSKSTSALVDHSTSSRSLLMAHAQIVFPPDEVPSHRRILSATPPPPEIMCCNNTAAGTNTMYNTTELDCCGGVLVANGTCA